MFRNHGTRDPATLKISILLLYQFPYISNCCDKERTEEDDKGGSHDFPLEHEIEVPENEFGKKESRLYQYIEQGDSNDRNNG
jgi:hypothetical protein